VVICLERGVNDLHYDPADATACHTVCYGVGYPGCRRKQAVKPKRMFSKKTVNANVSARPLNGRRYECHRSDTVMQSVYARN